MYEQSGLFGEAGQKRLDNRSDARPYGIRSDRGIGGLRQRIFRL